jgi:hypothetical protein
MCFLLYVVEVEEFIYVEIILLRGINRIFMLHMTTLICV